ncbi:MAG: hypothetical protein ACKOA8_17160 [Deltaproteobacteria bacterium]
MLRILFRYSVVLMGMFSMLSQAESSLSELKQGSQQPQYFAEFYSYEGNLGLPSGTHTFGRFVKIVNGKAVEKIDISWLPQPEYIGNFNRMPLFTAVPGKNHTLEETLLIAGNKTVTQHGKFSIDESLFEGARKRKDFLESGKLPYKMLAAANSDTGVNCIHALLGAVGDIPTGSKNGKSATDAVVDYFLSKNLMRPVDDRAIEIDRNRQSLPRAKPNKDSHSEPKKERNFLFPKIRSIFAGKR